MQYKQHEKNQHASEKEEDTHSLCKKHMHRYVMIQLQNGQQYDGIVADVDHEFLYLAVPDTEMQPADNTQSMQTRVFPGYAPGAYGFPLTGYSQPGLYGYQTPGFGGGYGVYPRRRFRRLVFPLAALLGLTLLPYF